MILTEQWASQHKEIHFSSMHPGWADTPGRQLGGCFKMGEQTPGLDVVTYSVCACMSVRVFIISF